MYREEMYCNVLYIHAAQYSTINEGRNQILTNADQALTTI